MTGYCTVTQTFEGLDYSTRFDDTDIQGFAIFHPSAVYGDSWDDRSTTPPKTFPASDVRVPIVDSKLSVVLYAGGPGSVPEKIRWRVRYEGVSYDGEEAYLAPFDFEVEPGATIDLTNVKPVFGSPPPGVTKGEKGDVGDVRQVELNAALSTVRRLVENRTVVDESIWEGDTPVSQAKPLIVDIPYVFKDRLYIRFDGYLLEGGRGERQLYIFEYVDELGNKVTPDHPRNGDIPQTWTSASIGGYYTYRNIGQSWELGIPEGLRVKSVALSPWDGNDDLLHATNVHLQGVIGEQVQSNLVGEGFPEGNVVAYPGSIYTDINGTMGALRWIKTSGTDASGWKVLDADTGRIDVTKYVENPGDGRVTISRERDTVTLELYRIPVNSASFERLSVLPKGFRSSFDWQYLPVSPLGTSEALGPIRVGKNEQAIVYGCAGKTQVIAVISFKTREPWPSAIEF